MAPPPIREFKLGGTNGDGLHPYVNWRGAFIGPTVPLVEKDGFGRWTVRPLPRLEKLLSAGYGAPIRLGREIESLTSVCRALTKGELSLAAIALVHAELPPLPGAGGAIRIALADGLIEKFDPDEPRVPAGNAGTGQWTDGGGDATASPTGTLESPAKDSRDGKGSAAIAATSATAAASPSILETLTPRALVVLGELAEGLSGPLMILGGILFPTPAGSASDGTLPGNPDIS